MKKYFLLGILILSFLFPTLLFPDIRWINSSVDLGMINESDGETDGFFKFIYMGDDPLVILSVKASCGCTRVYYPWQEILNGDTAVISFSFDPSGRPGRINKNIRVSFSDSTSENLNFTALVRPTDETLSKRYPAKSGDLRFETDTLKMNSFIKGEKKYGAIGVYNSGKQSIKPHLKISGLPIDVSLMPKEIFPDESATISFYIDTAKIPDIGFKESELTIYWGNNSENIVRIPVLFFLLPPS